MIRPRWKIIISSFTMLMFCLVIVACGETAPQVQKKTAATPTPVLNQGQQLLQQSGQKLTGAKTAHGLFHLVVDGNNASGVVQSEVWNEAPAKSRSLVKQSTVSSIETGSVTVSDGQQMWQYLPGKHVVYHGPVQQGNAGGNNPLPGTSQQGLSLVNLVRAIFTRSDGTLTSSNATVNNQAVSVVHVVPQSTGSGNGVGFSYEGDVSISNVTQLPVRLDLTIQGFGRVQMDIASLELNTPLDARLFTFVVPAGAKVEPFPSTGSGSGSLTVDQAQQQAGYHLLRIPSSNSAYVLVGVTALGAPGNQIYTLQYKAGQQIISLTQGKPLANVAANGQAVSLRGETATFSESDGNNVLAWTEHGVGIRLSGALSRQQLVALAQLLQ